MNNHWVKLYSKINGHEIIIDPLALQVFIWLLTSVDLTTGEISLSGRKTAKRLKMNPHTFRSVLERLVKKYEVITQFDTQSITQIKIKNWSSYQSKISTTSNTNTQPDTHFDTHPYIYKKKNKKDNIGREESDLILGTFNRVVGGKYKVLPESNVEFWLNTYTVTEICEAIVKIPAHHYWSDKMGLNTLFRQKNPRGESVDYIGELLSYKPKAMQEHIQTYVPYVKKNFSNIPLIQGVQ